MTKGRTLDTEVAWTLKLSKGSSVGGGSEVHGLRVDQLVDSVWGFLVTWLKKRVKYRVPERREVVREAGRHVRPDHRVCLGYRVRLVASSSTPSAATTSSI